MAAQRVGRMTDGEGSTVAVDRGSELQQYDVVEQGYQNNPDREKSADNSQDPHIGKRLVEYCGRNCYRWTEWELTPQGRVCAGCHHFRRTVGSGGYRHESFGDGLDLRPAGGEHGR